MDMKEYIGQASWASSKMNESLGLPKASSLKKESLGLPKASSLKKEALSIPHVKDVKISQDVVNKALEKVTEYFMKNAIKHNANECEIVASHATIKGLEKECEILSDHEYYMTEKACDYIIKQLKSLGYKAEYNYDMDGEGNPTSRNGSSDYTAILVSW